MTTQTALTFIAALSLTLASVTAAHAATAPPPNAKPLSRILSMIKSKTGERIGEAEFEHGQWEVKTCNYDGCQKRYIDPISGLQKRQKKTSATAYPRTNVTPITTIVKRLEHNGVGTITEVDFEHGQWEIKLIVAPRSAPL